jgi:hypothetical protein
MDNKSEFEDILKNIKVGDQVAQVYTSFGFGTTYTLRTVTKVTKTGQIEIDSRDEKFKPRYSSWSNSSHSTTLIPVTQDVLDNIEKYSLVSKLGKMKPSELNLDKLRRMTAILDE